MEKTEKDLQAKDEEIDKLKAETKSNIDNLNSEISSLQSKLKEAEESHSSTKDEHSSLSENLKN